MLLLASGAACQSVGFSFSTQVGDSASFDVLRADEVQGLMARGNRVFFYDANSPKDRETDGIIPGARLLSSPANYDVTRELPSDKSVTLVFYCHDFLCLASHDAAHRAARAGYAHVAVMAGGIEAWKASGETVLFGGEGASDAQFGDAWVFKTA